MVSNILGTGPYILSILPSLAKDDFFGSPNQVPRPTWEVAFTLVGEPDLSLPHHPPTYKYIAVPQCIVILEDDHHTQKPKYRDDLVGQN